MFFRKVFFVYTLCALIGVSTMSVSMLQTSKEVVDDNKDTIEYFGNAVLNQDMEQFNRTVKSGKYLETLLPLYDDNIAVLVKDSKVFNEEWATGNYKYGDGRYLNGGCLLVGTNTSNFEITENTLNYYDGKKYAGELVTLEDESGKKYAVSDVNTDLIIDSKTLYYTELIINQNGEIIGVVCSQYVKKQFKE